MLLFNSHRQNIIPRVTAGFQVPFMESSHHRCQSSSISDERLPVLVSEFIHLHCIKVYIIAQVISRIGTGHHPRQISDDIARHLERGARLVRLFAELGNFFPLLRSANIASLEVLLIVAHFDMSL